MPTIPYVTTPGSIHKALEAIQTAGTPDKVTQDFIKTILGIPGGSGNQITTFLKKIGFVNSDGSPSEIYKKFRNKTTAGAAIAEALKQAYAPLYKRNEYMHQLSDVDLRGLIIQETGQGDKSTVPDLILSSIKALKKYADFNKNKSDKSEKSDAAVVENKQVQKTVGQLGIGLSYTINLNLPATTDIAVFNAIFKSLKENLLSDPNET